MKAIRLIKNKGNFVDKKVIKVMGGLGGDGCINFHKDKTHQKGPANGGNGGNAGNVYIKADKTLFSLNLPYICKAFDGTKGYKENMNGARGRDLILKVPIGTIINELECFVKEVNLDTQFINHKDFDIHFDKPKRLPVIKDKVECELLLHDQEVMVAKGGRGGHGNPYFMSGKYEGQIAERGYSGEQRTLKLELKMIADIGLVGKPNAGKSTLLNCISNAKSKVGLYSFTTTNPYLGVIEYDDKSQITVADIPGLIEDAHMDKGLGHLFLKHVERSKALVYVLDLSVDPCQDYTQLKKELDLYKPGLSDKASVIFGNKADLTESRENINKLKYIVNIPIVPMSAKFNLNIAPALNLIKEIVSRQPNFK